MQVTGRLSGPPPLKWREEDRALRKAHAEQLSFSHLLAFFFIYSTFLQINNITATVRKVNAVVSNRHAVVSYCSFQK